MSAVNMYFKWFMIKWSNYSHVVPFPLQIVLSMTQTLKQKCFVPKNKNG